MHESLVDIREIVNCPKNLPYIHDTSG